MPRGVEDPQARRGRRGVGRAAAACQSERSEEADHSQHVRQGLDSTARGTYALMRLTVLSVVAVLALAGCRSAPSQHGAHVVTFTTAGTFPPETITGEFTAANCSRDTRAVVSYAREYYAHITGAPAPADLYYYEAHEAYAHFDADGCSRAPLGRALENEFTPRERRLLLRSLPRNLETAFRAALTAR